MTMALDARGERPIAFAVREDTLFGILTAPLGEANGTAVVLLSGGHFVSSIGRNRISVRLARHLAAMGYHVLRFDYHGVGESTGTVRRYRLDQPFVADLEGAVRWLDGLGLSRVVLVGSCFGARTALAAVDRLGAIAGLVLMSTPLGDYAVGEGGPTRMAQDGGFTSYALSGIRRGAVGRLRDAEYRRRYAEIIQTWGSAKMRSLAGRLSGTARAGEADGVSPHFLRHLEAAVRRRLPMLLLYGTAEEFYQEFGRALPGIVGRLLDRAGPLVTVRTIEGTVHGFPALAIQDAVMDEITSWIGGRSWTSR